MFCHSTSKNMTPPHTFAVIPKASILALSEDMEKTSVNRKSGPSPGLILQVGKPLYFIIAKAETICLNTGSNVVECQ